MQPDRWLPPGMEFISPLEFELGNETYFGPWALANVIPVEA